MRPRRATYNGDGWGRPDEGPPPSSRWTSPGTFGVGSPLAVIGRKLAPETTTNADAYLTDPGVCAGAVSIGISIDALSGGSDAVELDLMRTTGASYDGYAVNWQPTGGGTVVVLRYVASVFTILATTAGMGTPSALGMTFSPGTPNTIAGFYKAAGGGPWVTAGSASDATFGAGAWLPAVYLAQLAQRCGPLLIERADQRRRSGRRRIRGWCP